MATGTAPAPALARRTTPGLRRALERRQEAQRLAQDLLGVRALQTLASNGLLVQYASDVVQRGGAMAEAHKMIKRSAKGKAADIDRVLGLLDLGMNDGASKKLVGLLTTPGATLEDVREAILGIRELPTESTEE